LHAGTITLKKKGSLLHATQMNGIRVQLLKRADAEENFWICDERTIENWLDYQKSMSLMQP